MNIIGNNIKKKLELFRYILFLKINNINIYNTIRYKYLLLLLAPLIFFIEDL